MTDGDANDETQAEPKPAVPSAIDPSLTLVPITFDNAPTLAALLEEREVWRNFGYQTPPSSFALRLKLGANEMVGMYFHRPATNRTVGFVVLFGRPGPESNLELAVAIPDPAERKGGIPKTIGMKAIDHFFATGVCGSLWAWGDTKNPAMLGLAKACEWEILGNEEGGREMVDGHTETIRIRMTREGWLAWRARHPEIVG